MYYESPLASLHVFMTK